MQQNPTQSIHPVQRSASRAKRGVLSLAALLSGGVGAWMLIDPAGWYVTVPGVGHTGAFNYHFVRDIGVGFVTAAGAYAIAARRLAAAYPLLLVGCIWFIGHALTHVQDISTGDLPLSHAVSDIPGIFVPAVLAVALAMWVRPEWLERERVL